MQGKRALSIHTKVSPVEAQRLSVLYSDINTLRAGPNEKVASQVIVWAIRHVVAASTVGHECTAAVAPADVLTGITRVDFEDFLALPPVHGLPGAVDMPDFPDLIFFPVRIGDQWSLIVLCHAGAVQ